MIKTTPYQIMLTKELEQSNICPNCSANNSLKILSGSKFTHIACVPLYGFKSSTVVCSYCNQEFNIKDQNKHTQELAKENEKCIKLPLRYFTWTLILGGSLIVSLLAFFLNV